MFVTTVMSPDEAPVEGEPGAKWSVHAPRTHIEVSGREAAAAGRRAQMMMMTMMEVMNIKVSECGSSYFS